MTYSRREFRNHRCPECNQLERFNNIKLCPKGGPLRKPTPTYVPASSRRKAEPSQTRMLRMGYLQSLLLCTAPSFLYFKPTRTFLGALAHALK
jgi:hypothetical protein